MNCTTMTMFAPRIWGFDPGSPQVRVARQAGWRWSDLLWESLMETANNAWAEGDRAGAERGFRRARRVSGLTFATGDPRRMTALLNLAILAQASGHSARAKRLYRRALPVWGSTISPAIARMEIAPRARSSLFHLRMEARYRQTYHDNFRLRVSKIADEVRETLEQLALGKAPGCRLYARWRGERPNVYDDTRKVLGACLLIIDT